MRPSLLRVALLLLSSGCSLARGTLGSPTDALVPDAWAPDLDGGVDIDAFDTGTDALETPDAWTAPDVGHDAFDYPDSGCGNPSTGNVTLTLNATSDLRPGGQLVVDYTGMLGTGRDWIALMSVCSPTCCSGASAFVYTPAGTTSGTATIPIPAGRPPGGYVARAYYNDSWNLQTETPEFIVTP